MSISIEKLQKVLASDDIATQILTSKDRDLLIKFDEKVDRWREVNRIPSFCDEPEEIINEAFRLVPGSERVLEKQMEILDCIFKTGLG
ncbi:hypothetical protein KKH23_04030 [Patescibacteria group bacterium]|nr:hypothetical protein [Patescibacteria group bacterium]MBU0776762.1 hypothetical protein [Patescibacteria group bacterium]MBU0846335.1 hypothetical protein [Patescibacteria group bacterium]MBU0922705.1 hypothetical protein [Patescibacteria group bacterium]MBU1066756.1 hypothetical protein [Patescibacteria group bacterium]